MCQHICVCVCSCGTAVLRVPVCIQRRATSSNHQISPHAGKPGSVQLDAVLAREASSELAGRNKDHVTVDHRRSFLFFSPLSQSRQPPALVRQPPLHLLCKQEGGGLLRADVSSVASLPACCRFLASRLLQDARPPTPAPPTLTCSSRRWQVLPPPPRTSICLGWQSRGGRERKKKEKKITPGRTRGQRGKKKKVHFCHPCVLAARMRRFDKKDIF